MLGITHGALFRTLTGVRVKTDSYRDDFLLRLQEIQRGQPNLIPASLALDKEFGMLRSWRRGLTTWARNLGVNQQIIDFNNRWQKVDQARGQMPGLGMLDYYNNVKLSLPQYLQYAKDF